jgi:excisionase family DNA binding protein
MSLEERVLRVPEAAALLGVSASTYYSAAARGEVPAVRIGRRLVVPGAALARLLEGAPRPEGAITGRIGGVANAESGAAS